MWSCAKPPGRGLSPGCPVLNLLLLEVDRTLQVLLPCSAVIFLRKLLTLPVRPEQMVKRFNLFSTASRSASQISSAAVIGACPLFITSATFRPSRVLRLLPAIRWLRTSRPQPFDTQAHQTFAATVKGPRVMVLSASTASNSLTLNAERVGSAAKLVAAGLVTKACAASLLSKR